MRGFKVRNRDYLFRVSHLMNAPTASTIIMMPVSVPSPPEMSIIARDAFMARKSYHTSKSGYPN
jgi:hypothetical protein